MNRKTLAERLKQMRARRPWQLMMVAKSDDALPFSTQTNDALTRIFDLLPHLEGVTITTTKGDVSVSRDFPGGYVDRVDDLIASVFSDDPRITGIVFPATASRPEYTATVDDPHLLLGGKVLAAIDTARRAGEITLEESLRRIKALMKG